MNSEIVQVIVWWLMFFLMGIISFPATFILFKNFSDKGYPFSKIVGLLVPAYFVFLLSIFRLFPLAYSVILFIFLVYGVFNIWLAGKNLTDLKNFIKANLRLILLQEILFTLGYLFWVMIRGHQPDINGLEKFMDLGFINSILRTDYLPAADMWAAGEVINYYWFGHYLTAILTKLSKIPSHVTYNLMLATILGLTLTFSSSIILNLVTYLSQRINLKKAFLISLISAVLLTFGGNFHTPLYVLKDGSEAYWYPDATRFIGYNPETEDKTIHEFPLYSFVVSDLHAHLINLPLVLLYIALLWRLMITFEKKKDSSVVNVIPNGLLIGIMFMTSAWDFANYSLLTGITLLLYQFNKHKFKIETILETSKYIFIYLIVAAVAVLPFLINFESIADGVKFVNARTPLWQLAVLWGFPAVMTIVFNLTIIRSRKLKTSDIFVISILISSWILILLPEIIYVKDIYIASHHRANTMFKLTYQAFVMFYLSVGYIVYRSISTIRDKENKIVLGLFYAVIFTGILIYPYYAVKSYYNELKTYQGISGETWMKNKYPGYYNSIQWFKDNIEGQPVILEAQGDSYTDYNMVSAYTGLPTINGWYVHEWLWRGSSNFPQQRANEITTIYTSASEPETRSLLEKYDVKYIIIGPLEKEKYANINNEKFDQIGSVVFRSDNVFIYQVQ